MSTPLESYHAFMQLDFIAENTQTVNRAAMDVQEASPELSKRLMGNSTIYSINEASQVAYGRVELSKTKQNLEGIRQFSETVPNLRIDGMPLEEFQKRYIEESHGGRYIRNEDTLEHIRRSQRTSVYIAQRERGYEVVKLCSYRSYSGSLLDCYSQPLLSNCKDIKKALKAAHHAFHDGYEEPVDEMQPTSIDIPRNLISCPHTEISKEARFGDYADTKSYLVWRGDGTSDSLVYQGSEAHFKDAIKAAEAALKTLRQKAFAR